MMQGFEDRFTDFPDYILKITHDIWEGRSIGPALDAYYAKDIVVRTPAGVGLGCEAVKASTMETLHHFPDRDLLGEDVIWSGTPEDGMLSSHRLLSTATHLGEGMFGAPTGAKLKYRIIADCYAKDNQISDEWLIRDNGAIVRQIGLHPSDWAEAVVAASSGQTRPRPFHPSNDVKGPYGGTGEPGEIGAAYEALITRIMDRDFAAIPQQYDRAVNLFHPGGVEDVGWQAADKFWLALRSALPTAKFEVHHVIGRDADPMMPPRASLRWSLTGTHSGYGAFGAPSGAELHVMGMCHAEYGPWGLRREYVVYDETAIWTQIHLHKSA